MGWFDWFKGTDCYKTCKRITSFEEKIKEKDRTITDLQQDLKKLQRKLKRYKDYEAGSKSKGMI